MIAGTLCGGSELALSGNALSDFELPSLLDGLCLDGERRYWIERLEAQEINCDIEVDTGHMSTGVEIVL